MEDDRGLKYPKHPMSLGVPVLLGNTLLLAILATFLCYAFSREFWILMLSSLLGGVFGLFTAYRSLKSFGLPLSATFEELGQARLAAKHKATSWRDWLLGGLVGFILGAIVFYGLFGPVGIFYAAGTMVIGIVGLGIAALLDPKTFQPKSPSKTDQSV